MTTRRPLSLSLDPTYIKAKFLYQCKKKQKHFTDPALRSWGWNQGVHFCRHTKKQQVLAEIVAPSPCHHDLLWSRLDSTGTGKWPLQPHYSTLPGIQELVTHNWRQIHRLHDFKPYLSPIPIGLTSLYLLTILPTEGEWESGLFLPDSGFLVPGRAMPEK